MKLDVSRIQQIIKEKVTDIEPKHNEDGHFYFRKSLDVVYPSVNGKINILKEKGLNDWMMNRALDFVFQNISSINETNMIEMRERAENSSTIELQNAGDIGTEVHDYREQIFSDWIARGKRPDNFCSYIPKDEYDIRAVSCLGALESFCNEYHYQPVATELLVFSDQLKLGGTLDDIGIIRVPKQPQNIDTHAIACVHDGLCGNECFHCGMRFDEHLVLMDLKTSNQLKSSYWIQVALYYDMFAKLTGIKPKKQFILKLDKYNRTYKVEFIKNISQVVKIAKNVLKVCDGMEEIKKLREKEFITI